MHRQFVEQLPTEEEAKQLSTQHQGTVFAYPWEVVVLGHNDRFSLLSQEIQEDMAFLDDFVQRYNLPHAHSFYQYVRILDSFFGHPFSILNQHQVILYYHLYENTYSYAQPGTFENITWYRFPNPLAAILQKLPGFFIEYLRLRHHHYSEIVFKPTHPLHWEAWQEIVAWLQKSHHAYNAMIHGAIHNVASQLKMVRITKECIEKNAPMRLEERYRRLHYNDFHHFHKGERLPRPPIVYSSLTAVALCARRCFYEIMRDMKTQSEAVLIYKNNFLAPKPPQIWIDLELPYEVVTGPAQAHIKAPFSWRLGTQTFGSYPETTPPPPTTADVLADDVPYDEEIPPTTEESMYKKVLVPPNPYLEAPPHPQFNSFFAYVFKENYEECLQSAEELEQKLKDGTLRPKGPKAIDEGG